MPQALTCHLLHEAAKGPASFWAPYIAALPRREEYDLLASWSATEIEQLQAGILCRLRRRTAQVDMPALLRRPRCCHLERTGHQVLRAERQVAEAQQAASDAVRFAQTSWEQSAPVLRRLGMLDHQPFG